jgi:hypothetical protein
MFRNIRYDKVLNKLRVLAEESGFTSLGARFSLAVALARTE